MLGRYVQDAVNAQGNSALHYCYGYGHFELGEYLVAKGADPGVRNVDGLTPRDTLSAEQLRTLGEVKEAFKDKVVRHNRHATRKAAAAAVSDTGDSGEEDPIRRLNTHSEASSGGEDGGSSESEGNLDSYRALYSARKM